MAMFKKIFATVPEKDFYNFKDRAREEDVSIGDALRTLAILYAHGATITIPKHKEKEIKEYAKKNIYLKEHNDEQVDNDKSDK